MDNKKLRGSTVPLLEIKSISDIIVNSKSKEVNLLPSPLSGFQPTVTTSTIQRVNSQASIVPVTRTETSTQATQRVATKPASGTSSGVINLEQAGHEIDSAIEQVNSQDISDNANHFAKLGLIPKGFPTPSELQVAKEGLRKVSENPVLTLVEQGESDSSRTTAVESGRSVRLAKGGVAFDKDLLPSKNGTLDIVGHGSADGSLVGGKTPAQLAKFIKDSGITQLRTLNLKSCHSEPFARALSEEIDKLNQAGANIQIGEITGSTEAIVIDRLSGQSIPLSQVDNSVLHDGALGLQEDFEKLDRDIDRENATDIYDGLHEIGLQLRGLNNFIDLRNSIDNLDGAIGKLRRVGAPPNLIEKANETLNYALNSLTSKAQDLIENGHEDVAFDAIQILMNHGKAADVSAEMHIAVSKVGSPAFEGIRERAKELHTAATGGGAFSSNTTVAVAVIRRPDGSLNTLVAFNGRYGIGSNAKNDALRANLARGENFIGGIGHVGADGVRRDHGESNIMGGLSYVANRDDVIIAVACDKVTCPGCATEMNDFNARRGAPPPNYDQGARVNLSEKEVNTRKQLQQERDSHGGGIAKFFGGPKPPPPSGGGTGSSSSSAIKH